VRCGLNHASSKCSKPRNTPAKCALCLEDHPANYKGCRIYQDLRKTRQPKSKNITQRSTQDPPKHFSSPKVNPTDSNNKITPTYAQIAANSPDESNNLLDSNLGSNKIIFDFLNEFKSLINPLLSLLTTVLNQLLTKNVK